MQKSILIEIQSLKVWNPAITLCFQDPTTMTFFFSVRKGILTTRSSTVQAPLRSRFKSSAQSAPPYIKEVHLQLEFCEILPLHQRLHIFCFFAAWLALIELARTQHYPWGFWTPAPYQLGSQLKIKQRKETIGRDMKWLVWEPVFCLVYVIKILMFDSNIHLDFLKDLNTSNNGTNFWLKQLKQHLNHSVVLGSRFLIPLEF